MHYVYSTNVNQEVSSQFLYDWIAAGPNYRKRIAAAHKEFDGNPIQYGHKWVMVKAFGHTIIIGPRYDFGAQFNVATTIAEPTDPYPLG